MLLSGNGTHNQPSHTLCYATMASIYIIEKCDRICNDLCDPHRGCPNLHNHRAHKFHWNKMRNITTMSKQQLSASPDDFCYVVK